MLLDEVDALAPHREGSALGDGGGGDGSGGGEQRGVNCRDDEWIPKMMVGVALEIVDQIDMAESGFVNRHVTSGDEFSHHEILEYASDSCLTHRRAMRYC